MTVSFAEATPSDTVNSNVYVPAADAVNVGFATDALDNVTPGPAVRTHAYVNVPASGSADFEPSNVTTAPIATDWSAPASATGG